MYEKLERLRSIINDLDIEDRDRYCMIDIIDDIERELDIDEDVYNYLSDEDNYD